MNGLEFLGMEVKGVSKFATETITERILEIRTATTTIVKTVTSTVPFVCPVVSAVLLPTFQYDSATNWTMRSKISFVDQKMAFDSTEERGMAKPQYPFLFHTLQITANQAQRVWSDTVANTILYFLSITTFISLYILLRSMVGSAQSAITITAIVDIRRRGIQDEPQRP
jgi:hypothetical protein